MPLLKNGLYALTLLFFGLHSCTCFRSQQSIRVDGSSTVYPLSEAMAEEYKKIKGGRVSIGISGTGGGFKKLCSNRVSIIGASRKITTSEKNLCAKNQVEYMQLPVAYDGIVVVVNKKNDWLNEIRVSTLKTIFEPKAEKNIIKWSHINPSWPNETFEIFMPGVASGTYDYFTKAIVGTRHSSRGDVTSSEDDNVLVYGVANTKNSIGFFSFAYYVENKDKLKALAIIDDRQNKKANRKGVVPTKKTIQKNKYTPLSRKIFIYAHKDQDEKHKNFLNFYLNNSFRIANDVGLVPLKKEEYEEVKVKLKDM